MSREHDEGKWNDHRGQDQVPATQGDVAGKTHEQQKTVGKNKQDAQQIQPDQRSDMKGIRIMQNR